MDELFDTFDAVSSLSDISDLADHSDTILSALDGLDFIELDAGDLSLLDDLSTFSPDDFGSVADAFHVTDTFIDTDVNTD